MEYDHYVARAAEAGAKFDRGEHEQAMAGFIELVESDISDLDKAMMCLNLGTIAEKLGQFDETLAWYDLGMRYEEPHCRLDAAERKASFLYERGRITDALALYDWMLGQAFLTEQQRHRFNYNVGVLRGMLAAN